MSKGNAFIRLTAASLAALFLTACGGAEDTENGTGGSEEAGSESSAEERGPVEFGVAAGPYGIMVEDIIGPLLEEEYGYQVSTRTFSDYVQPNLALDNGDIDANLFQHTDYFETFSLDNDLDLDKISTVPTLGMGVYASEASGYASLDDIESGARILTPNDPSNLARALRILADYELISYDESVSATQITVDDITGNPYELVIEPIESAQITRSLESSAELATVPGNYSFAADLDPNEALAMENMGENFFNLVAVQDLNSQLGQDIQAVIESEAFYEAIEESETFSGFNRPSWWPEG